MVVFTVAIAPLVEGQINDTVSKRHIKLITKLEYSAKEVLYSVQKNDLMDSTILVFNNKDHIISESAFFHKGYGTKRTIYSYDSLGHNVEQDLVCSDHNLSRKIILILDKNGNTKEMFEYDLSGKLETNITYNYDINGLATESYCYLSNGRLNDWTTYKHDTTGNVIERYSFNFFINQGEKIIISYDNAGNVIEEKYFSYEGVLNKHSYTYEFDQYGHWIKMIQFINGSAFRITTRTIEYY